MNTHQIPHYLLLTAGFLGSLALVAVLPAMLVIGVTGSPVEQILGVMVAAFASVAGVIAAGLFIRQIPFG